MNFRNDEKNFCFLTIKNQEIITMNFHCTHKTYLSTFLTQDKNQHWERTGLPLFHQRVLNGTWAFKLKRTPDGVGYRYKSRFCVLGDQQEYGINYFETFAPLVQWSTIRLLLILILTNHWTTRVIDHTNAFLQANIDTEVYMEPPALFGSRKGEDKVLKLRKSLYGLKQSPRIFLSAPESRS